jgi:hypothetical protein
LTRLFACDFNLASKPRLARALLTVGVFTALKRDQAGSCAPSSSAAAGSLVRKRS